MRGPLRFAPVALVVVPGIAQTEAEYRSERHGCSLRRPIGQWRFVPSGEDSETLTLNLARLPARPPIGARLTVSPDASGSVDRAMREALRIAGGPGYSKLTPVSEKIGGKQSPGIEVELVDPTHGEYRVRQHFLVHQGMRYVLQCHAPVERWEEYAEEFAAIRRSLRLVPISDEARARAELRALAARCGSEIDWASSWQAAAERASDLRRPVLVVVRRYPGFTLPDTNRTGVFMDPDVIELVGERFVALQLEDGMPAPFRSQSSYGMGPSTFGNGLLIVSPDGEVLRETHATDPAACYAFLVQALDQLPRFAGAVAAGGAERALRRGELARAAELLAEPRTGREWFLAAQLHRKRRDAKAALAALAAARDAGFRDDLELSCAIAVIHLRAGDTAAAAVVLTELVEREPAFAEVPRVRFWRAVCDLRADRDVGKAALRELCESHPDSRWAWQAAALCDSLATTTAVVTEWPRSEAVRALRTPARAEPAPIASVVAAALAFMLREQRDDGSWVCPSEVAVRRTTWLNPFVIATTALGGRALLQRDEVAAATKALEFIVRAHAASARVELPTSFMDYTVWSESIAIWFLADCVDAGVGEPAELRRTIARKVAILASKRRPSGGWSYYVTGDLARRAAVPPQAMSFTTAAVVLGLARAKAAGVDVDDELLDGALACIERGRQENGAFDYMVGTTRSPAGTRRPGAAGRGPLCELALLRAGRGDPDRLRGALSIFEQHRDGLHRQLGKVLMHAGDDGQGCHYLMFDYATAASAVRELPEGEREAHAAWLLDLILAARSVEGGFRDTPINGWALGTALALLAFHDLGR